MLGQMYMIGEDKVGAFYLNEDNGAYYLNRPCNLANISLSPSLLFPTERHVPQYISQEFI